MLPRPRAAIPTRYASLAAILLIITPLFFFSRNRAAALEVERLSQAEAALALRLRLGGSVLTWPGAAFGVPASCADASDMPAGVDRALAAPFLTGSGLEIGALHSAYPRGPRA